MVSACGRAMGQDSPRWACEASESCVGGALTRRSGREVMQEGRSARLPRALPAAGASRAGPKPLCRAKAGDRAASRVEAAVLVPPLDPPFARVSRDAPTRRLRQPCARRPPLPSRPAGAAAGSGAAAMIVGLIQRLLPKGRFARHFTILSGGTTLGQAAVIASSPLLTRLYGPEEFGVFSVFSAVAAILSQISALRYEAAVPVCRREEDAAAIALAGAAAALLLTCLTALLIALLEQPLAAALGIPGHGAVLWLMPPLLLTWGLSLVLGHWSIRHSRFRVNAVSNMALSGSQAVGQVALGWLSGTVMALVVGWVLGSVVRCLILLRTLPAADLALFRRIPLARVAAEARRQWHYPAYSGSSALLQSMAQMLPAVLVAILYGPAAAGWFGLGQRITGMPTRMVSEAAAQAYLGEIGRAEGPAVHALFKRTVVRFFLVGMVGLAPLLLAGPALFAFVFGEPWRQTGTIVQVLVPLHLARFVVLPVSQTLNIVGRQHHHLIASLLTAAALLLAFALAAWLDLSLLQMLLVYSLGSTATFLYYLACSFSAARAAARGHRAQPVPAEQASSV